MSHVMARASCMYPIYIHTHGFLSTQYSLLYTADALVDNGDAYAITKVPTANTLIHCIYQYVHSIYNQQAMCCNLLGDAQATAKKENTHLDI